MNYQDTQILLAIFISHRASLVELEIIHNAKVSANFSEQISNTIPGFCFSSTALFEGGNGIGAQASIHTNPNILQLIELTKAYSGQHNDFRNEMLSGYSFQKNDEQGFDASISDFIADSTTYNNLGLGFGINGPSIAGVGLEKNEVLSIFNNI